MVRCGGSWAATAFTVILAPNFVLIWSSFHYNGLSGFRLLAFRFCINDEELL